MRFVAAAVAAWAVMAVPTKGGAALPALTITLLDAEPVGIRVTAPSAAKPSCASAPVVFEGVLEKGKPLAIATDGFELCVSQTEAPFTKSGLGQPLVVRHLPGMPPLRLVVRSRRAAATVPPIPTLSMTPLTIGVIGDGRIGVRIGANTGFACIGDGGPLFSGVLEPGVPRAVATEAACVCVEQTHTPFVNIGWTSGRTHCRPTRCTAGVCAIDPDAPFVVGLPSRAPL